MYIAPAQGYTAPREQTFDGNRKALSLPISCKFQRNLFEVWFNTILFHDLIHVYSPAARGIQTPGDKVFMSIETSCHFGHLCWFQIIEDNSFWKIHCFTFFSYKSIRDQIWPCHKIGQGQPRVIIWINLVVLEHQMLPTKFQGHQPFDSGEEDCLRFLLYMYMGMAAILVMWPGSFEQIFVPPIP